MNARKKLITALIPAYNEGENIGRLLLQLDALAAGEIRPDRPGIPSGETLPAMTDYEWEFLFVNDGSRDDTHTRLLEARAADPRIKVVNLSRNFGKENAMLAGLDFAEGDAVVIVDADLQHPLAVVPEMVYWWEKGADDVYGLRRSRGRESWLRKKFTGAFYSLLQGMTRIEILQNVGDFRLLDRRVVDTLKSLRESQRYTKGLYCWAGFTKKAVAFDQNDRAGGKSSFNLRSLFNLAVDGITCFTTSPLRIATIVGLITSLAALAYLVFVVLKTIIYGEDIQGFPTLLCVILLLGGVQLLAMGIIGEYVGRIFNETKNRPVYIVDSLNGEKYSRPPERSDT